MPRVEIGKDDAWRTAPSIRVEVDDTNEYHLKPGGRLIVIDAKTGDEKYVTTMRSCTCPAGDHGKYCKHVAALERLSEP